MSKTKSLEALSAECDSAELSADLSAERSIVFDGAQYIAHPSTGMVCSAEDTFLQIYRTAAWDAQLAFDRLAERVSICRYICQETLADLQSKFFHEHGEEFVQIGCIVMQAALELLCDPATATDSVCTMALEAVARIEAMPKAT